MSYTTSYIKPCHCMLITFSDDVTSEELIDSVQEVAQYVKKGKDVSCVITDYSEVIKFDVFAAEINAVAELTNKMSKSLPNLCVAVVAPQPAIFGSSRMWEVFTSESNWKRDTFIKKQF